MDKRKRKTRILTEEHKNKISISKMGEGNPAFNKPLSEKHKNKISDSVSGSKHHSFNFTIYKFHNPKLNLEFIGNSYDFRIKYDLPNQHVNPLIRGLSKSVKGWQCLGKINEEFRDLIESQQK